MNRVILALPLALAACGTPAPEPLVDYHAPFLDGKAPGVSDVRPMPRPAVTGQRIFPACDKWPDDCGSTFTPPAPATPPGWTRPDVPPFDFTPELPAPTPAPQPEPEGEPEPTPEAPVEQWGPA